MIANEVPLLKKRTRDKPGNYRPVSLLTAVGKLLEETLRGGLLWIFGNVGIDQE